MPMSASGHQLRFAAGDLAAVHAAAAAQADHLDRVAFVAGHVAQETVLGQIRKRKRTLSCRAGGR